MKPITDPLTHRVSQFDATGRAGSPRQLSQPSRRIKTRQIDAGERGKGIGGQEPHRLYWVRLYIEARQWRAGLPKSFQGTQHALNRYIATLRQNWAIERRYEAVYVTLNQRIDAHFAVNR